MGKLNRKSPEKNSNKANFKILAETFIDQSLLNEKERIGIILQQIKCL